MSNSRVAINAAADMLGGINKDLANTPGHRVSREQLRDRLDTYFDHADPRIDLEPVKAEVMALLEVVVQNFRD